MVLDIHSFPQVWEVIMALNTVCLFLFPFSSWISKCGYCFFWLSLVKLLGFLHGFSLFFLFLFLRLDNFKVLCSRSAVPARLSVQVLPGYATFRYSGQPFWSGRVKSYTKQWARLPLSFPASVRVDQTPGLSRLFVWGHNQVDLHALHWVVCLDCTTVLSLQMSKIAGWAYSWVLKVGTCSAWIWVLAVASPSVSLSQPDSQWSSLADSLAISVEWDQSEGELPRSDPQSWGKKCLPWAPSRWSNRRLRDLSVWCCDGLGEWQCSQYVHTILILFMWSGLVSGPMGSFNLTSCSRIFSVVSYP